ncbi:hypothetical protein [Thalassobellus suaedae]|uniref:Fibronectin type-III domain-containing protein n=1 Tax=Thalassobellus suaedae TaxID=3074124 RepID=A0ABY9XXY6_9FLAO|nr:hypothetical protein RHP51_08170 [Flavobacteriaceae bacterium HL-DH14]
MKRNSIYKNFFMFLILVMFSCSSESTVTNSVDEESKPEVELPTLQTNEAESIGVFQASIWGKVLNNGGSSVRERGVCYSIIENPTYNDSKKNASVVKGSGDFMVDLTNLKFGQVYYAKAYAINEKGIGYGNEISFTTSSINPPIVLIGDTKVASVHDIWLEVKTQESDEKISEVGIVYSTLSNPTIESNKIVRDGVENNFKQRITVLDAETLYYIKSYTITPNAITYSDEIAISTIKQGNFTWSFWWEDTNADAETQASFDRIRAAFDEATWYYNNFTSIEKHVNVNYSPGTPTADANFDGWINFGSNPSYQKTGTAMHEMAHTVGVGQHWKYTELMQGSWQGNRANAILKFMTNDSNALIYGDNVHFYFMVLMVPMKILVKKWIILFMH